MLRASITNKVERVKDGTVNIKGTSLRFGMKGALYSALNIFILADKIHKNSDICHMLP
jgi:hypothetical protein